MHRIAVTLLIFILWGNAVGQEVVLYKGHCTPAVRQKSTAGELLELPVTDDFAYPGQAPDPFLWSDSGAYINNSYCINPPTIGVATFDAVNRQGNLYNEAQYGTVYQADKLVSRPINLKYPGDRTIFLSFYYQPQGNADPPELRDSLVVDFYSPQDDTWYNQWSKAGSQQHEFRLVMLPVDNEKFLREGFRFRFRNYASLSGSNFPDLASNCDHWHIDYVHLDQNRNPEDTVFNDLAFVTQLNSFFKEYEAVPWEHYKMEEDIPYRNAPNLIYRNLDDDDRAVDTLKFVIRNTMQPHPLPDVINAGAYNVPANSKISFNKSLNYQFPRNKQDSAAFDVTARLSTDAYDRKANNEANYTQRFYNDYAYDDGTAEGGYGLSGEGTKYAEVAYKFHTYSKDTLRGVKMYFNSTLNHYTEDMYFYLKVWDHEDGKPGKELYSKTNYQPDFDSLNRFQDYPLRSYQNDFEDTAIVVEDTFYVGWMQTSNDILNVGLDFNRNASEKLFYNISGIWKQSTTEAALMMRPIFGPSLDIVAGTQKEQNLANAQTLKLYPNPATTFIKGRLPGGKAMQAVIYNQAGQAVVRKRISGSFRINVQNLPQGLYIIRARNRGETATSKFLIAR